MSESKTKPSTIASVEEYYRVIDSGEFPDHLFAPDFEFYLPKFGVGRGKEEFFELVRGLMLVREHTQHHRDRLRYFNAGDIVVAEGTTEGRTRDNVEWCGGKTPGGRFCSVFEFDNGLIKRMFIYMDPDVASADKDRFLWPERRQPKW